MEEFTPIIEPLSLDEAFLDVTGITHKFTGPKALGRAIKDRVFEETGLIISAGLAPNKFLAKLASDLDKPDGLVVIPYGKECESLANLPIKRIWGVGPSTERRLKDGGFALIKDVQALSDEKPLVPYVGNQARRIWELARGIDERPVEPDRQIQSVGNEETYESDVEDPAVIDLELHYFANRVAKRLRKYGLMGHTVSIKVRYNDFKTVSRQNGLILLRTKNVLSMIHPYYCGINSCVNGAMLDNGRLAILANRIAVMLILSPTTLMIDRLRRIVR